MTSRFRLVQNPRLPAPRGVPSHVHSKSAGTCFALRSCKRSKACLPPASYQETDIPARLPEISSDRCRRSGRAFCADGASRVSLSDCFVLAGLAHGRIYAGEGNQRTSARIARTSPILAISCAAVISPTPYMAWTVSYSGSCLARRNISVRMATSVVFAAMSYCAAVVISSLVMSFFGSVVT